MSNYNESAERPSRPLRPGQYPDVQPPNERRPDFLPNRGPSFHPEKRQEEIVPPPEQAPEQIPTPTFPIITPIPPSPSAQAGS